MNDVIGNWSDTATALVNRVSEAIGGIARPHQIRRIAKAKADAKITETLANIACSDLEQRALLRSIKEEGMRQKNIEQITMKATNQLENNAKPNDIKNDWITNFFDKCKNVTDEEMQGLWARILADEANNPGTYGKRTIATVSTLEKSDAHMFTKICQFAWFFGDLKPLIFNLNHQIYENHGVNFPLLKHLDDIGLITINPSGFKSMSLPKQVFLIYFGIAFSLQLPSEKENSLQVGQVLFTKIGQELAPISGATRSKEFLQYVLDKWTSEKLNPKPVQIISS